MFELQASGCVFVSNSDLTYMCLSYILHMLKKTEVFVVTNDVTMQVLRVREKQYKIQN